MKQNTEHTKGHFLRQLGHLSMKTRRFPSPFRKGFGFIGRVIGNSFFYCLPGNVNCQFE